MKDHPRYWVKNWRYSEKNRDSVLVPRGSRQSWWWWKIYQAIMLHEAQSHRVKANNSELLCSSSFCSFIYPSFLFTFFQVLHWEGLENRKLSKALQTFIKPWLITLKNLFLGKGGGERGSRGRRYRYIYIYNYDWFTLMYGKDHIIVKQLSSSQKKKKKRKRKVKGESVNSI